jgi:copper chaperone
MMRFQSAGMTCDHCAAAITRAVRALPDAGDVEVSLDTGVLVVSGHPDPAAVRAAVVEEGYAIVAS